MAVWSTLIASFLLLFDQLQHELGGKLGTVARGKIIGPNPEATRTASFQLLVLCFPKQQHVLFFRMLRCTSLLSLTHPTDASRGTCRQRAAVVGGAGTLGAQNSVKGGLEN